MNFISIETALKETEDARRFFKMRMAVDEANLIDHVLREATKGIYEEARKGKSQYTFTFDIPPFSTSEEFAFFVDVVKERAQGFAVIGDYNNKGIHFLWYTHSK